MSGHNETCTDTEFIQLWGQLQSATRVAEHLGISVRATHLRRRWIEKQYNMALPAIDHRGVKYDKNKPRQPSDYHKCMERGRYSQNGFGSVPLFVSVLYHPSY